MEPREQASRPPAIFGQELSEFLPARSVPEPAGRSAMAAPRQRRAAPACPRADGFARSPKTPLRDLARHYVAGRHVVFGKNDSEGNMGTPAPPATVNVRLVPADRPSGHGEEIAVDDDVIDRQASRKSVTSLADDRRMVSRLS